MKMTMAFLSVVLLAACASPEEQKQFNTYKNAHAQQKKLIRECVASPQMRPAGSPKEIEGICSERFSMKGEYARRCFHQSVARIFELRPRELNNFDTLEIAGACAARLRPSSLPSEAASFHELPMQEKEKWEAWDDKKHLEMYPIVKHSNL